MNNKQKQILNELKETAEKLGHSPKRREIPNLAKKCYRHFGSFNKAKKSAGLPLFNEKVVDFPKGAFKLDKDLAIISSYLTFDGHLYKDLKGFMYSSKNIKDLKKFEKIVKSKFGNLREIYHLNSGGAGENKTHKIYFFNKIICNWFFDLGIPKGDKSTQVFDVPSWVKTNKEFSREYLKIAYFCEGSFKESANRTPRIQISIAKSEDILNSGLKFIRDLKMMLKKFDINTTKSYILGKRLRKRDNKITRDIKFRVDIKDNNKFIKEIGWLK